MGLWTTISDWFNKFVKAFKVFVKLVFDSGTKVIIGQLSNIALNTVTELASTNLSNEDKRSAAFGRITDYALKNGINVRDSLINLVIEMAVRAFKNMGE